MGCSVGAGINSAVTTGLNASFAGSVSAIAAELKAAGAARVYALTFAKVKYSRPSRKFYIRMGDRAAAVNKGKMI